MLVKDDPSSGLQMEFEILGWEFSLGREKARSGWYRHAAENTPVGMVFRNTYGRSVS